MDLDTVTLGFGLQGTWMLVFSTWTLDLNWFFKDQGSVLSIGYWTTERQK
jgi:hypothetical protein